MGLTLWMLLLLRVELASLGHDGREQSSKGEKKRRSRGRLVDLFGVLVHLDSGDQSPC